MAEPQSSSVTRHVPALDGLRGVAVLLVYLYHYGGGLHSEHIGGRAFGYLTESGWSGVVLFFVLSGFLITGNLFRSEGEPHRLRNFYLRRALRILPLYYVSLALAFLFALATSVRYEEMKPFLVYAAFLQNVPPFVSLAAQAPPPLPLYHFWTLAVEEQFYLLWPALFFLMKRPRTGVYTCVLLFLGSFLFRTMLWNGPTIEMTRAEFAGSLPVHAGALALGAALAFAQRFGAGSRLRQASPRLAPALLILSVSAYLLLGLRTGSLDLRPAWQFTLGLAAVSVAAAALLLLALRPGPVCQAFHFAPLRWIGRISYGVYVFHILLEPVFNAIGAHIAHLEYGPRYQAVRFVVALPISLLAAGLSFALLESPFLDLKRHFPLGSASPVIDRERAPAR